MSERPPSLTSDRSSLPPLSSHLEHGVVMILVPTRLPLHEFPEGTKDLYMKDHVHLLEFRLYLKGKRELLKVLRRGMM